MIVELLITIRVEKTEDAVKVAEFMKDCANDHFDSDTVKETILYLEVREERVAESI